MSFSEENLVACDRHGTNDGCNGGFIDTAFSFVKANGGLCTEADYPYVSGASPYNSTQLQCATCNKNAAVAPESFNFVTPNSTQALMSAVVQQPVSIAIQANSETFKFYSSGVYTADCGLDLDHAVLVVGYGISDQGIQYWKVKNSWSTQWGLDGYILLERNITQEGGQCGMLLTPVYPVL